MSFNPPRNLAGEVFGRLTVLSEAPKRNQKRYWRCLCECGNTTEVRQDNLLRWRTEGCGCKQGQGGAGIERDRLPTRAYELARQAKETGDPGPLLDWLRARAREESRPRMGSSL